MTSDEKDKINQRVGEMLNIDKLIKHSKTMIRMKRRNRIWVLSTTLGFLIMSVFIGQITANATRYDQDEFIQTEFKVDDRKVAEHWPRQESRLLEASFPELPDIELIYDPSLNNQISI